MVGEEGYRLESRLFGEQGMFGTLDESLDFADGYFLGKAVGTFLLYKHSSVYACVASDSHPLSVPLESEIVRGLLECGVRVLSFSVSPTPLVRFAAIELRAQVAFSVTRGSQSQTHSGVKIFLEGSALDAERALQLRNIAANGNWRKTSEGRLAKSEGVDAYTMRLFAETAWRQKNGAANSVQASEENVRRMLPRVLLAQGAHGSSKEVLEAIAKKLSAHAEQVFVLEDAAALRRALREEHEQVGFLFNSDGTALQAFVGGRGEIQAEELFDIILRGTNMHSRKGLVLADGLTERRALEAWRASGVRVERCAQFGAGMLTCLSSERGAKMRERVSPASRTTFARATFSCDGHIAFYDSYYPFEDAFYVALRFLSALATGSLRMETLRALPARRVSGLLRILVAKAEGGSFCNKDALLMQLRAWIKAASSGAEASEVAKGSEVAEEAERNLSYGRWIVRVARFEEALLARCEGKDEESLGRVKADLQEALSSCGIESVLSEFVFS